MDIRMTFQQVILFCADVEKLVNFYIDCFGFSLVGTIDNTWSVLDTGQTQIAFHRIGEGYLNDNTGSFSVTDTNVKLVFEVATDLALVRQMLLSKHVDVDEIKLFPGYPYATCDGRDPEGNVFQLSQKL